MEKITLKSGKVINWHKCPRYVLWRHGRTAHTFQLKAQEAEQSGIEDPVERGLSMFESLSEFEAIKLQKFADDIIKNSTDESPDELSEEDYWEIFGLTMYSNQNSKIETEDGETDVESVESFSEESVIQDSSPDVQDIPPESSPENGNTESIGA